MKKSTLSLFGLGVAGLAGCAAPPHLDRFVDALRSDVTATVRRFSQDFDISDCDQCVAVGADELFRKFAAPAV